MAAATPAQGKLLPKSAHGYKISSVQPLAWHKCSDLDPADKISQIPQTSSSERISQPHARIPQPRRSRSFHPRGSPSRSFRPREDPPAVPFILADPSALDRIPLIAATINALLPHEIDGARVEGVGRRCAAAINDVLPICSVILAILPGCQSVFGSPAEAQIYLNGFPMKHHLEFYSSAVTGTEPLVLSDLSSTTRHGIVGVFRFAYHGFRSCIFGVCSHYNALIIEFLYSCRLIWV
uniref:Uncharacterized protein n=1 Tax=Zea mays TaxID=4577 RepID=A0A804MHM1_MAIZE